jgi:hypothetical protein
VNLNFRDRDRRNYRQQQKGMQQNKAAGWEICFMLTELYHGKNRGSNQDATKSRPEAAFNERELVILRS